MRQLHIERAPGALDVARSDRLAPGPAGRPLTCRARAERVRAVGRYAPADVARQEPGDHEPSLSTLARLSAALGIDFTLTFSPSGVELRESA
jgi:transcriptional regulator with XRE-family HTH domain